MRQRKLVYPDADDRHVLAAAIQSKADVIVTMNLKDFPAVALLPFQLQALHPDEFACQLLDSHSGLVCSAVKRHRESLKRPPKTVSEFLTGLEQSGLPQTCLRLSEYSEII